jgi:predicted dehydrogenase
MKKTRIAVIGLGGIAQLVHLPILSRLDNAELCAVADIDKTRLFSVASKFGVKAKYTDYREMIEKEKIDALILSTPTNTHKKIALECFKYKIPMLIEKPVALNYAESVEIRDAAKKAGVPIMVGMNLRFRPDSMLMKSFINSGDFGELFYIRSNWLRRWSSEQNWFLKKKESGGGVLIDLGIAVIDLALWLFDAPEIKTVSAQSFNHLTRNVEDSAVALIRTSENNVINFEISWSMEYSKDFFGFSAYGNEGSAHLNPFRAFKRLGSNHVDLSPSKSMNIKNLYKKSYENEIKHFLGIVNGNYHLISSCDEAVQTMKVLENIYKSTKSQFEVAL